LSTVNISPFSPSKNNTATDSEPSRFSVKIFSPSVLARGPENSFFFYRAPNLLSAALYLFTNLFTTFRMMAGLLF